MFEKHSRRLCRNANGCTVFSRDAGLSIRHRRQPQQSRSVYRSNQPQASSHNSPIYLLNNSPRPHQWLWFAPALTTQTRTRIQIRHLGGGIQKRQKSWRRGSLGMHSTSWPVFRGQWMEAAEEEEEEKEEKKWCR